MRFPSILLVLLISISTLNTVAQTDLLPSNEQLQELKTAIQDDSNLDPDRQETLLAQVDRSIEHMRDAAQYQKTVDRINNDIIHASNTVAAIRTELKTKPQPLVLSSEELADLPNLERQLLQTEAEANAAQQRVNDLEERGKTANERLAKLPELLATARSREGELEQYTAFPSNNEAPTPQETEAQRWLNITELHSVQTEISLYKLVRDNYDTLTSLQNAQLDQATRHLGIAKTRTETLREAVDQQRRIESEAEVASANQAREEASKHHPAIQAIAERNANLAALRAGEDGLSARQRTAAADLQAAKELTRTTQLREEEIRKRIEAAGLTHAVAQLLNRERINLPNLNRYGPRIRMRKHEIVNTQLAVLDFRDQREELRDIAASVQLHLSTLDETAVHDELAPLFTEYLTAQRDLLDTLISEYNDYFNLLVDLDTAEHLLIDSVNLLDKEIKEHILWVRSDTPFGVNTPAEIKNGFELFTHHLDWKSLGRILRADLGVHPYILLALLFAELALIGVSLSVRSRMIKISTLVSRIRTDRFGYTMEVLFYTVIRALPIPLPLFYLAWRIGNSDVQAFTAAIGQACLLTGILTLSCCLFYQSIKPFGLAEVHFGADKVVLKKIRRLLVRLMATALPLLWITKLLHQAPEVTELKILERICYIGLQLMIAWFAYNLFSDRSKVMRLIKDHSPNKMLVRLRFLALFGAVGIPTAIIISSLIGYYFTALAMSVWFTETLGLVLAITLVEALSIRAIEFVSRRAEFNRRVRERQEQQEMREAAEAGEAEPTAESNQDEGENESYITLSENARKLMNIFVGFALLFGLWFIWSDVVPALNLFDRIVLWHVQAEASAGEPITTIAISLADVTSSIIIIMLTVALTRHLPSLVELALLRQLRMSYGERYAVSTIIRYVTIAIGTGIAFSMLGIGWSKFKWLAAALSVGLGFGLQEIFANFISGLILLFERPIRVRDYVTVNGTSGQVSRIQIRATTITDWDNKELLIPNKQFVTGELVNWTLTSAVLRVVIKVGIAYGSDTKKAEETLLRVAKNYRLTIEDPAPTAFFTEFGDSSLNFELRVFIANAEQFRLAKHELNLAVDAAFREAGIVIAFPQLDVHMNPEAPVTPTVPPAGSGE